MDLSSVKPAAVVHKTYKNSKQGSDDEKDRTGSLPNGLDCCGGMLIT